MSEPNASNGFSAAAQAVLDRVMERVRSNAVYPGATTHDLLFALLEADSGGDDSDAGGAVLRTLWKRKHLQSATAEAGRRNDELKTALADVPFEKGDETLTAELTAIVADAGDRALGYGETPKPIHLRHLVIALLDAACDVNPVGAAALFRAAGLPPETLRRQFVEKMVESVPADEREAWRRLLPLPEHVFAHYDADRTSGDDALSVTPYVNAMANLIASNKLRPPLSIALFGDWGSGKTFFMDRLAESVDRFANRSEADRKREGAGQHYWPHVVQIRFNAWHYVDTNLWASLVTHIFDELRQAESPKKKDFAAERTRALERLKLSTMALESARGRKRRAALAMRRAKERNDETRKRILQQERRRSWIERLDPWRRIRLAFQKDPKAGPAAGLMQLKTEAFAAMKKLGVTPISEERVKDLDEQLVSLTDGTQRLQTQLRVLFSPDTGGIPIVIFVGLALVAVALSLLGPEIAAQITMVVGVVTSGLTWLNRGIGKVASALEPVERLRTAILDAKAACERQREQLEQRLDRSLDRLKSQYEVTTREAAEARRDLNVAMEEYRESRPGVIVRRFIEERASSEDYRKHLGIVSVVRQDFEWLSRSIRHHNDRQLERKTKKEIKAELEGLPEDLQKFVRKTDKLGINRIVLYIDDLDRCPAEKVVDVLQAIHLLLAFELFVVVVGVDSRWLMASLADQYPDLLTAPATDEDEGAGSPPRTAPVSRVYKGEVATPVDYLEKVFQIPFWLRPIDDAGCRGLIRQSLSDDTLLDDRPTPVDEDDDDGGDQTTQTTDFDYALLERVAEPESGSTMTSVPEPPDPLKLHRRELAAMEDLAWLIGRSPRAVKRFVNTYRLLKATQTVPALTRIGREAGPSEAFRGPMLLLALATGVPEMAALGIRALRDDGESGTVDGWLETISKCNEFDAESLDRLRKFRMSDAYTKGWCGLPVTQIAQSIGTVELLSFVVP